MMIMIIDSAANQSFIIIIFSPNLIAAKRQYKGTSSLELKGHADNHGL